MTTKRLEWDTTIKRLAALLSGGAALVSILSFIAGRTSAPGVQAALGVAEIERLEVLPVSDTAYALGDTLRLTAMAADGRGLAVLPSRVLWQTEDSAVAIVDSAGRVSARGAGSTVVTVAAGARIGRARVTVAPRATSLTLLTDSVPPIAEGTSLRIIALVRDARGHPLPAPALRWTAADQAIATIDSTGTLTALTPGHTTITVSMGELLLQRPVEVLPVPATLTLAAGAGQRAPEGQRLAAPLAVQVVSRSGRPVANVTVRFDATPSGGAATPDSALSDSAGLVRARWTLGPRPGRQQLHVSVTGIDSPLVVSAESDPLPASTRISLPAESLSATVLEPLGAPILVQLSDTAGLPLADVPVAWSAPDGGALLALNSRSDSLGQVLGRWTLGPKAGRQRLRVQVGNPRLIPARSLTAIAAPAAAARLAMVSGDRQVGIVGQPLARDMVLAVTDSLGNLVPGAAIRLHRPGTAPADTGVRTGADGRLRLRLTLPTVAGPARLMATLPGRPDTVRLQATAHPGPVDTLRFISPPATAIAGRAPAKPFELRARDRYGNPVPGIAIRLAATAGRLSAARAVTDSAGAVTFRWTPGPAAGRQTLTATLAGSTPRARHALLVTAAPRRAGPVAPPAPKPKPVPPSRSPFGT